MRFHASYELVHLVAKVGLRVLAYREVILGCFIKQVQLPNAIVLKQISRRRGATQAGPSHELRVI